MTTFQLDSDEGLKAFNDYLVNCSYAKGFKPSQTDANLYNSMTADPCKSSFPHVARWYKHMASFSDEEKDAWEGEKAAAAAAPAAKAAPKKEEAKEEDEIDLFGDDDDEDAKAHEELIEKRAQEQLAKKKATGKVLVAKSMVTFDVKPYESETNMKEMEDNVRSLVVEGLEWKASKLVDVAYGIKKLQIAAVVIDDIVSVDDVVEQIQAFEDHVQSVDIASFNKL